jgi:exopolyphosphatase/pppGpp-phosphohydrolase
VAERRGLLVEPARAEVIVGGAVVLATLMHELGLAELRVSECDILDGLAASLR